MNEHIKHFSDDNFKNDVLAAKLPVLVDFWAEWCGPCRALGPIIEKIAPKYAGRLIVGKMNVDENTVTPADYGVRGIPTMILVKDGEVVATQVGLVSEKDLMLFIDKHIKAQDDEGYESDDKSGED